LPEVGSRIHVAYKGTKLPGRGSATSTTWEHLEPALLTYKLVRVELKGLRRSVTVNAEDSDDVRQDISEIASSLEDTYYVQSVTVRTDSAREGTVDTQIDFGKSLAVSTGDAVLADLTQAVQDLLIRGMGPIHD
jgi:methyl coenzyme M reductase subunit D